MKKPLELGMHFRIDKDTKTELDEVAEYYSTSPSQIIRHLIQLNLSNMNRNRMYT